MVFQRIRDMREDADLKQNDMAKILHCSQQAYSNYELGQRDIPTDILIALAEYHKTNVDYLLGLTKNKTYYKDMQSGKNISFRLFATHFIHIYTILFYVGFVKIAYDIFRKKVL